MTSYNDAQMEYREKCKQRIGRQLQITGKSPSDDELEELLESGNFDVFTQVCWLMQPVMNLGLKLVEVRAKS